MLTGTETTLNLTRIHVFPILSATTSWISAIDTLAKLHKVDHVAIGLESYGKSAGFYRRQIASLSKVSAAQAAAKDAAGVEVGPIPDMAELAEWFKKYEVKDSTSIVHGDYKVKGRTICNDGHAAPLKDWCSVANQLHIVSGFNPMLSQDG